MYFDKGGCVGIMAWKNREGGGNEMASDDCFLTATPSLCSLTPPREAHTHLLLHNRPVVVRWGWGGTKVAQWLRGPRS